MTRRFDQWNPTPPFRAFLAVVAVVLILFLLSGCSFLEKLERLTHPTPQPDTRTVLERNQILEVNIRTGKLLKAPHLTIEDFRCATPPMMCSGSGTTMDCRCP